MHVMSWDDALDNVLVHDLGIHEFVAKDRIREFVDACQLDGEFPVDERACSGGRCRR